MPITLGTICKEGLPPPYEGFLTPIAESDSTQATSFSFPNCIIGTPHSKRLVVFIITQALAVGTTVLTGVSVSGVSATLVTSASASNSLQRYVSLWQVSLPIGTTATFALTYNGSASNVVVFGSIIYPANPTPLDFGTVVTAANPIIVTDIATEPGGWTLAGGRHVNTNTTTYTLTWNGTETPTIVQLFNAVENIYGYISTVASTTTLDWTMSCSLALNMAAIAGSWGPPPT